MDEVHSLKSENNMKDVRFKLEMDKLVEMIQVMQNRENDLERDITEKVMKMYGETRYKSTSPNQSMRKSPSRGGKNQHNKEYKEVALNIETNNELKNTDIEINTNTKNMNENEEDVLNKSKSDREHSSNYIDTMSRQESHHENPYTNLIIELKHQIKYLESTVVEREEHFNALRSEYERYKFDSLKSSESMKKEIEHWQYQYNLQLVGTKTLYDEFVDIVEKKEKTLSETNTSFQYELEKKIIHLEKVNAHLTFEMEKINEKNLNYIRDSETKILRLNEQNAKLLEKYEDLWKVYENDLNTVTELVNRFLILDKCVKTKIS